MRFRVDSFLWRQEVQLELDRLGLSWDYDLFCLDSNNPEHQYAIEVLGRFVKDSLIELLRDTYRPKAQLYGWDVDFFRETLKTAHGFIVRYPDSLHYGRIVLLREKVIKGLSRRGVRFNFDNGYRDGEGIRLEQDLYELIDLCNRNTICEKDLNSIRELMDEVCEFTECFSDSPHCGKLVLLREDAITALSTSGVVFDSDGEHVIGNEVRYVSFGNQLRGKYNDAQRIESLLMHFAWGRNEDDYEAEPTIGKQVVGYDDNRPDEIVDKVFIKEHVREIVELLPEKQRDTIKLQYGLCPTSCVGRVGQRINISRQGIHEREQKALKRLRLLATVEDAEWVGVSAKRRAEYLQEREEGLSQLCVETAARNERLLLRRKLESIANTLGVHLEQILVRHKQGIPIDKMSRAYTPAPAPTIQRLILLRNKWVLSVNELLGIIGCDDHSLAEARDRNGLYVKWTRQNTIKGLKNLIGNVNDLDFEKAVSEIGITKEEYLAGCYDPTDAYLDCLVMDEKWKRHTRLRTLAERLGVGKDELRMMIPRSSNDAQPSNEIIARSIARRIYDWVADPLDLKWLPMSKKQE